MIAQPKMMDLDTLVSSSCNQVEIYVCPQAVHHESANSISVGWTKPLPSLPTAFGNGTHQDLKEYHYRDMTYVYDIANDGQRVYRKLAQKEHSRDNLYGVSYIEDTIPSHRFPCTTDITHECNMTRTTYRINNRMFFVHDIDDTGMHYYYVRYQHSPNVDVKKMQQDLNRTLASIKRTQSNR